MSLHYRVLGCLAASLPLLASSGCLVMHASEKVVRQDERRERVDFESDFARRSFQGRALSGEARREAGGKFAFGIPFIAGFARSTVVSQNAWYNDQIAVCDADGDRLITDDEVLAFGAVEDAEASAEPQIATDAAVGADVEQTVAIDE